MMCQFGCRCHTACLYGTTDNASLLTNAKVRLYNCDSAYDVFSIGVWSITIVDAIGSSRGVEVNFDLRERFPRPRSQQRGSLRPRARRVAVLGVGAGGGRSLPLRGSRDSFSDFFQSSYLNIYLPELHEMVGIGSESDCLFGQLDRIL